VLDCTQKPFWTWLRLGFEAALILPRAGCDARDGFTSQEMWCARQ
jgi:hypothetical protein